MKKVLAIVLAGVLAVSVCACGDDETVTNASTSTTTETSVSVDNQSTVEIPVVDDTAKGEGVMTYAEYVAAELDTEVVVECYVQDHQSWWDNAIKVYAADQDGAYFIYDMACSEEDAAKLVPGTKIKVTGYKSEWGGEVEIADATFEFEEGSTYVADVKDLTDLLGTDELIDYQNQYVVFKDLVVEEVSYKNGEPGDDIYITASKDGKSYSFCLEYYLNGSDEEFYNSFADLYPGTVCDFEGYLYWYYGMNPHITGVNGHGYINDKSEGTMNYIQYAMANLDDEVTVEFYVQATQSWWDNAIKVYGADIDGGYFAYDLACSEEDAAKLVPGTLIKVHGYKSAWSGEVEIVDGTFEIIDSDYAYIAPATDVTSYVGQDEISSYMNQLVSFTDMTVEAVSYKNDTPGDDIYVTLSKDGVNVEFCLEYYLNGSDEELYNTVGNLAVGLIVDVEGYLYYYEGPDAHLTAVTVK